jgi:methionine biosynthesis protein MetW
MDQLVTSRNKIYSGTQASVLLYFPPITKPTNILDLGCGAGSLGKEIKENSNAKVTGVTISEEEKLLAEKELDECIVYNLENGLPDLPHQHYDIIVLSHVLEHICYPENLLEDIKKVLKPNGIVIVALPNIMHYRSRINLALGKFEYTQVGIYDYTHFRWYTFKSAENLFKNFGYKTVTKDVIVHMPFGRITNKYFGNRMKATVQSMLKKISRGFFGWELIYVFQQM